MDSLNSSSSDPVMVSRPSPGVRPASMNTTSPPYAVHPSATATPGARVRSETSISMNVGVPSAAAAVSGVITACDTSPSARRRAAFRHRVRTADSNDQRPGSGA